MSGDVHTHHAAPRRHRRSIRLRGYDYTRAGAYFVTICVQDRECLFGDIVDGQMRLNEAGRMVQTVWDELPDHYPNVDIDAFVVMPNHIHGIIVLPGEPNPVGAGPRACPVYGQPWDGPPQRGQRRDGQPRDDQHDGQPRDDPPQRGQPRGVAPTGMSLPDVVHRFKSLTTARYRHGVRQNGWKSFRGRLWQRNYYEHIIRDECGLNRVRQYIARNPAKWAFDREHPVTP